MPKPAHGLPVKSLISFILVCFLFWNGNANFAVFSGFRMEKITVLDKTFVPYIRHEELMKCIDRVAEEINADFRGAEDVPVILCILNGSIMFTGELMQRLDFPCQLVSTKMTSYVGTSTTGEVKQMMPLTASVKGRRVIVAEDIIDTGLTLVALKKILMDEGAAEVRVCSMLFKPEAYRAEDKIDYIGKSIPNRFILGFGLDYNELGRNLRDIYVLED